MENKSVAIASFKCAHVRCHLEVTRLAQDRFITWHGPRAASRIHLYLNIYECKCKTICVYEEARTQRIVSKFMVNVIL